MEAPEESKDSQPPAPIDVAVEQGVARRADADAELVPADGIRIAGGCHGPVVVLAERHDLGVGADAGDVDAHRHTADNWQLLRTRWSGACEREGGGDD